MVSSDDEAEFGPQSVSNYHFVDDDDAPTSFSVLPLHWSKSEDANEKKKEQIFVHGSVDNGLQTIHKEVTAWKFDLLNANPEISVLTKENSWIKLEKPRKSFEEIIRTVLITVQCLHFASRNPDASEKSIWDHLSKVFSFYEVRPSQNDLVDHMALISESVKRDQSLSKSKFLLTFLEKKPRKRKLSDEDVKATPMSGFIVDMDDGMLEDEDIEEDTSNEDDDLFDSVCALCDNGGELLCCDGICMRSYHATEEAARNSESNCKSLGLSRREVEANSFYCKNCEYKQHQCFACGELGSSDKSSGAEVFQCASATCGYFYHPHCIAKLLHQEGEAAEELEKNVAAGQDFFICPIHKCCVCKQGEDKKIEELQFAVCRRCPTSYHRKCLPREIGFEKKGEEDDEEDVETRAWEGLLPGRILIYCLKHEIIDDLGTPIRDVRFPDVEEKRKKQISELPGSSGKVLSKKRRLTSEDSFSEKTVVKEHRESSFCMKKVANTKKSENISSGSNSLRKVKENDGLGKSFKGRTKSATTEVNRSEIANISLGDKLFSLMTQRAEVKLGKHDMLTSEPHKTMTRKISAEKLSSELSLDAVTERRLLALMKEVASSITLEDVINKRKVPSTHSHSLKTVVEKTINAGKVVGAVEAVRTALNKLETGCSAEDAKAVCEPEVLNQLFRWKNKLAVYLAPFLRGKRYTSFGRHFTKIEKLEKIVDILHWYMQDGDMIVDFCCGANDFSCLMKKKLEEMGKKCSYKNYDLIQPKIDFNFEKRDWMTVRPDELPKRGSQLIMGLNPPFGVKASLANKFINQALKFKPKLLILIVPPETERLDEKNPPYDLVWEDDQCLSGKSFYLPGSVNESDKQMDQWNLISPPLYLWSRRDWSARHKAIAQKYGHVSRQQEASSSKNCLHKTEIYDHPMEVHCYNGDASELTDDLHMQNKEQNREICVAEGHGDSSPQDGVRANQDGHDPEINQSKETLRMRKHGEDKLDRGINEKLLENTQNGRKSPGINTNKGVPHHTSPKVVDGRSSQEGRTSRSHEMHLPTEAVENRLFKSEPGISGSHYKRAYGSSLTSIHDDVGRSYSMSYDENLHGIRGYSCANLEEQSSGAMRERADVLSQVRHYGQDPDYSMQRNYTGGQYPGYGHTGSLSSISYGNLGAAAESSYRMNMSAMQRYAPRLDEFELNHARMNSYGPDPMNNYVPDPSMFNRNGMYNPQLPRPGYHVDSMGFAPGPHHPYSHHNSAGWLNE